MGVTGIIVNNISEIVAMGVFLVGGYNLGVLKQRHFPNLRMNPLRWFKR